MAGSITISSITLDSDNNFSIKSNTGATLFFANTTGIDVANSLPSSSITNDKIVSVANTKITGILSVANGGTGAATLAGANIAVTTATNTFTAAQELATGTAIASASTINLDTATGNRVHITGTTTITAVTLTRGPRTVIFDGVLTLTHNSTTNNLPGAANITTAAGDRAIYESDGTTVYCVSYIKASGAAVVAASSNGGATTTSSGTSIVLTSASNRVQAITMTAASLSVTLPDATTLTLGGELLVIKNTGTNVFAVRDTSTAVRAVLAPGQVAGFYLTANATSAGVWAVSNNSMSSFLLGVFAGAPLAINASNSYPIGCVALSATQLVVAYLGASSYIQACTLNISGTTITAGAIFNVTSAASGLPSGVGLVAMSSTQAIVMYGNSSNQLQARTLNISGTTITAGTEVAVNSTATCYYMAITKISATQAIAAYYTGVTGYSDARTLNISGTSITFGTAVEIIASPTQGLALTTLTADRVMLVFVQNNTGTRAKWLTVSGTNLTQGSPFTLSTRSAVHCAVASISDRLCIFAASSSDNSMALRVGVLDVLVNEPFFNSISDIDFAANAPVYMMKVSSTSAIVTYGGGTTETSGLFRSRLLTVVDGKFEVGQAVTAGGSRAPGEAISTSQVVLGYNDASGYMAAAFREIAS